MFNDPGLALAVGSYSSALLPRGQLPVSKSTQPFLGLLSPCSDRGRRTLCIQENGEIGLPWELGHQKIYEELLLLWSFLDAGGSRRDKENTSHRNINAARKESLN